MITYSFTEKGSDPLYEHLYKCIKNDILQGTLKSGEKLPSKRSFAKNLDISVITVENAYSQLAAEGYIYSLPKKGFYVSDIKKPSVSGTDMFPAQTCLRDLPAPEYLADFTSNAVPSEQFPFSVWSKLLREVLNDSQEELLTKSPGTGSLSLRRSIAGYIKDFRGMNVDPERIVIGAGTEYMYGMIVRLLGHDRCYGIEDPGYQKTAMVYAINDAKCAHVPLDDDGISITSLEQQGVDVAHISPSHHFPTGIITPVSKRYELLGWAAKDSGRYIIEDDYDSEFRMTGKPLPTLMSIDTSEKVIYMNTFSKSLSAAMRVSYMVLPAHLAELYREKMFFYSCPVNDLIQIALSRFIDDGGFERHINRMRQFYKKQRDLLISEIKFSKMSKYVSVSEADSGLHFILNLNIGCSDEDFRKRLLRRGIKISALSEYYAIPENRTEHRFVINYSSLTGKQIHDAVTAMGDEVIYAQM